MLNMKCDKQTAGNVVQMCPKGRVVTECPHFFEVLFACVVLSSCSSLLNDESKTVQGREGTIMYYSQGALYQMDVESGHTQTITDSADGGARWSPDGKQILYLGPSMYESSLQVYVMKVDGSGKRIVTLWERLGRLEPHPDGGLVAVWSPDGGRIAFTRCINCEVGGTNSEIFIIDIDTSVGLQEVRLTNNPFSDGISDWSPDGEKILFRSDFSLDDSYDARGDWYTINIDGSGKQRIAVYDSTFSQAWMRYSPDGRHIAFIGRTTNNEIYIMGADGANIKRITNNYLHKSFVSWSPDGTRLAFTANGQIYLVNVDGSGLKQLTTGNREHLEPEWRPKRS